MVFSHTVRRSILAIILPLALILTLLPTTRTYAAGQVGNGTPASCNESALRDALAGGGSITFNCGSEPVTITVSSALSIDTNTTIDGGGSSQGGLVTLSGGNQTTIMLIEPGVEATIRNLTFRDGRDIDPDPMRQVGGLGIGSRAVVSVINSKFINNDGAPGQTERGGGAISAGTGATLLVRDSDFTGNRGVNGGAINMLLSSLTVEGSTFTNNESLVGPLSSGYISGCGGAIYVDGASPENDGIAGHVIIRSSIFTGNKARDQGGALFTFVYTPDTVTIEGSTITNNVAGSAQGPGNSIGGGLRHANGPLTIRDTTIADNTVFGDGGAVWAGKTSPGVFTNVTISGNRAEANGSAGGLWITDVDYSFTNATIVGNHAVESGGALIGGRERITINNTIIADNAATNDTGYSRQCHAQTSGSHNLQWPDPSSDYSHCVEDIANANPLLDVLGANGGQTPTVGLLIGSPAIDAGSSCPETDQRGADRVGACDIGAFEFGATAPTTPFPGSPVLQPVSNAGSPLVMLNWNSVTRATRYEVTVEPEPGTAGSSAQAVSTGENALALGLDKGSYAARVRACNAAGCSDYSTTQTFSVAQSPQRQYLPLVVR